MIAGRDYLKPVLRELSATWPDNRTVNIVCHGHSVPAGYFMTPWVNTFEAYPHQLHRRIKEKFPFAVVNVIVSAIGGENSLGGEKRFERDVLDHHPDVITIDYGLNDRFAAPGEVCSAWERMIEAALEQSCRVILLTPTWDTSWFTQDESWTHLVEQRESIMQLADRYEVGLADSFGQFERYVQAGGQLSDLLSYANHPSAKGHELAAAEIAKYMLG